MTGAFLRVERDGKFENVEIEHLTEAELEEKFLTRSPEELVSWLKLMCYALQKVEPLLEQLERDGIIQSMSKEEYDKLQQEDDMR
jgi:hypothetical protein